ncbi:MAG TPA: isochorismate synthase [Myxococcales bacterium]|nr:isochorismate synthase [Myxococcales bacterium]
MTSPIPDVSPLQAYGVLKGAALFWAKPACRESVAGFGAAQQRNASPRDPPFALLDELCALSRPERIIWLGDTCQQRPLGPWFGGFAFDPRRPPTPAWRAFPSAQWLLPELLIWSRGERTFATAFHGAQGGVREAEKMVRSRLAKAAGELRGGLRAPQKARRTLALTSDRRAWENLVDRALSAIETGWLSKVVVARKISAQSDVPFDLPDAVNRLCAMVPECTVFSLRGGAGATFLGATPETLCRLKGRSLESEAIAGCPPRPSDAPASSDKEAREHRAVVEGIDQALQPLCAELHVDPTPGVLGLPHVRHLRTEIRGRLHPDVGLSRLVGALHPTPAVGGVPRDRAMQFLTENEGLDRGWYAAPIGWVGDDAAELAVGIRSALIRGRQADLFVGAGVVAGSTDEGEWLETEDKSLTLLEALGGCVGTR